MSARRAAEAAAARPARPAQRWRGVCDARFASLSWDRAAPRRRGLVISPVSFQSTLPGVGSSFLGTQAQLNGMYTKTQQQYGVMSTRIYTTVGNAGTVACGTTSCTYGGAIKAMMQARTTAPGMTGACASACAACGWPRLRAPPRRSQLAARGAADAAHAQSRWASRCPRCPRR